MPAEAQRRDAVAELVGGLCYALLRVFHLAADAALVAPTVALADRQMTFALEEMDRYRALRDHLVLLTDDVDGALLAFREPLDAFYERARARGWLETQTFAYVGSAITTDLAELLASRLDHDTAEAVRRAIGGRSAQELFALEQIASAQESDGAETRESVAHVAGTIVGEGLNRFRQALLQSDALAVVFGGPDAVKDLVLELLGRHRERLVRLGFDTLE